MTDLQSTLDAIDAALSCQQCGGALTGSPSDDFCDESCQQTWHAGRATALPAEARISSMYAMLLFGDGPCQGDVRVSAWPAGSTPHIPMYEDRSWCDERGIALLRYRLVRTEGRIYVEAVRPVQPPESLLNVLHRSFLAAVDAYRAARRR